jgi:hypothetical protein
MDVEELAAPHEKKPLTPQQRAKRAANAKGKRIEKMAVELFRSQGYLVQRAARQYRWLPNGSGGVFPRMMEADFFEVWDLMLVKGQRRCFAQITVLGEVSHKRTKIRLSKFPVGQHDMILGYEGRGKWRKLIGPEFLMPGETITCRSMTKLSKTGSRTILRRRGTPRGTSVSVTPAFLLPA